MQTTHFRFDPDLWVGHGRAQKAHEPAHKVQSAKSETKLWPRQVRTADIVMSGGRRVTVSSCIFVIFALHKACLEAYEDIKMPTPHHPPAAVRRALRKLGADIHDARRRRRLPMAVVAERAFTSRSTLQRIEAGDASVGIGIYAGVLHALGLLDGVEEIADIGHDAVGQALASTELPRRSRGRRSSDRPGNG